MSAFSSVEEYSPVTVLDDVPDSPSFSRASAVEALDESDAADINPESRDEARQLSEDLLRQSASTRHPFRDSVTIHVCRGVGENRHLTELVSGLRDGGWDVVMVPPESLDSPSADARRRVALGLGLGATAALRAACEGVLAQNDGVVAVCPFLGFDAPMYPNPSGRGISLRERAFQWAGKRFLRPLARRVECISAYTGLGRFVSEPISWADLAACAHSVSFSDVMSQLGCSTVIVLDRDDLELDAERAAVQIPAMNAAAALELRSLAGEELLAAVEHALFGLFRSQSASSQTEVTPAIAASEGQPL